MNTWLITCGNQDVAATAHRFEFMSRLSLKEIAKLAETSKSTVSLYLNQPNRVSAKTATRIKQVIDSTGYSPNVLARNFRKGNTKLIIVGLPTVSYDLFEQALVGAQRVAREKGYTLLIQQETDFLRASREQLSRMIVSKEADGVLTFSSPPPAHDHEPQLQSSGQLPFIVGFEFIQAESQTVPSVHIDNSAAAQQATEYLISMGHRKIAFLGAEKAFYFSCERQEAYKAALEAAGLPVIEDLIITGDMRIEGGRRLTRRLLSQAVKPTAIFCAGGDEVALGAIHEIKSAGLRVPQDISVVGFDDIDYAEVCDPPLTTVAQPAEEIGEKCMYRLCAMIEGEDTDNTSWILPHKLVIRNSVARAPA